MATDGGHRFSKIPQDQIRLLAGLGVEGDAHAGVTVQHRSHVARDPARPNLRQVHLLPVGFLEDARGAGFDVGPGDLGENLLTAGIDLLGLPVDARLRIGAGAVVRITGLRNPCAQINRLQHGLLKLAFGLDESGHVVRKAGVMGVVETGGFVRPGDPIRVGLPNGPRRRLECV